MTNAAENTSAVLEDVQNRRPDVALGIDRVGVRGLRAPVRLRDRAEGSQVAIAIVELGADLSPLRKGAHMSRFVETLNEWSAELDYHSMRALLSSLRGRLEAGRARAKFSFAYLVRKIAPRGGGSALMAYDCSITGELDAENLSFALAVDVPVMTVCPCSKAISSEGAHSQRAMARIGVRSDSFVWIEDIVDIAESSGSSAVYPLLKRADEKFVTELAFSRPFFVEDVARQIAAKLRARDDILQFDLEIESMESIHSHNAFARIQGENGRQKKRLKNCANCELQACSFYGTLERKQI